MNRLLATALTLLAVLFAAPQPAATGQVVQQVAEDPNAVYVAVTDKWIVNDAGGFRIGFATKYRSVPFELIGYPITGAYREGGKIVQYFQRQRMEYQLDSGVITFGLLGNERLEGPPPVVQTVVVEKEVVKEVPPAAELVEENRKYEQEVIPDLLGQLAGRQADVARQVVLLTAYRHEVERMLAYIGPQPGNTAGETLEERARKAWLIGDAVRKQLPPPQF